MIAPPEKKASSSIRRRMLTFFPAILAIVITVQLEIRFNISYLSWVIITGMLMMGMVEFNSMLRHAGLIPFDRITLTFVPAFMMLVAIDGLVTRNLSGRGTGFFVFVVVIMLAQIVRVDGRGITNIGGAILSVFCTVIPGSFLYLVRIEENGLMLILYLIAVSKMTDNGALFTGMRFGRRKISGRISSGKSVEGMIGGVLCGTATAVGLAPLMTGNPIDFRSSLFFGVVISSLSLLGDLIESLFKREAGLKDSGNLLPGVGGLLDLMDSLLLSAPAGYLMIRFLEHT